jgi:hypothetical protein
METKRNVLMGDGNGSSKDCRPADALGPGNAYDFIGKNRDEANPEGAYHIRLEPGLRVERTEPEAEVHCVDTRVCLDRGAGVTCLPHACSFGRAIRGATREVTQFCEVTGRRGRIARILVV